MRKWHASRALAWSAMLASVGLASAAVGSSSGDVDGPLRVELDVQQGNVFPHSYRQVDGRNVGTGEMEGLIDPCVVRLMNLRNSTTGDRVSLVMNRAGPLVPGEYVITSSRTNDPADVPGTFLGGFVIGADNAWSRGKRREFFIESGMLVVDSVANATVRGRLDANGAQHRYRPVDEAGDGNAGKLSIVAEIEVPVTAPGRRPYSDHPYACLDDGAMTE